LKSIKRKYPGSHITWVTESPCDQLLQDHPFLDRVLTTKGDDLLSLSALEFDAAFVIDKSLKAAGILRYTQVDRVFGFKADPRGGGIVPATASAEELWQLGLDNHRKFFVNKKAETQLMTEALELGPFQRDEYFLPLTRQEALETQQRRLAWKQGASFLIGLNTGCSAVIPYKKWTVDFHREVIRNLPPSWNAQVVLLGGPEDSDRNQQIGQGLPVVQSATTAGLRDGLISVAACDLVVSGDSLGMHMAISQKKHVIAWFGPTCAAEIDLYGRGEKIQSTAACAPCWKRLCHQSTMCYDQVSLMEVIEALKRGFSRCQQTSSSKPPFSEICS
jgi:heptosyltransferase-2